jgi:hypothetical protein
VLAAANDGNGGRLARWREKQPLAAVSRDRTSGARKHGARRIVDFQLHVHAIFDDRYQRMSRADRRQVEAGLAVALQGQSRVDEASVGRIGFETSGSGRGPPHAEQREGRDRPCVPPDPGSH